MSARSRRCHALNRRAAEAVTVREAVTELLTARGAGGAGDGAGNLNDEPDAPTTQILHGPPGSEIGTGRFGRLDQGDGQRLWNLATHIPQGQRCSRLHRGRPEPMDHILASHAMVGLVPGGVVTTDGAGPVPSITDDPSERRDAAESDHRPVIAAVVAMPSTVR